MPSQAGSLPLAATLLAALWLALGRCSASESLGPGCDNGKLYLDRDLPTDAVYWGCSVRSRPESTQRLPSIDTVCDPEPARQICMDYLISYNHSIPNSGAFRPVMAESGEYLYCPPQRWLNNLHHGATVLLYHPCVELSERRLLSVLARSCLPGHIITPHPQLSRDMPIALVSWGRTLELTTVASSEVCDWLQATQATRGKVDKRTQTRKYNLLLTRSAALQHLGPSAENKVSVRQCCEQTISSLLRGINGAAPGIKKDSLRQIKEGRKNREIRAAIAKKADKMTSDSSQINKKIPQRTVDVQNHSSSLGPESDSHPGQTRPLDPSFQTSESETLKQHQTFTSSLTPHLVLHNSESLLQTDPSQHEGTDPVRDGIKERNPGESLMVQGRTKDEEVVDVKEREAKHNRQPTVKPLPTKSSSALKSQSEHRQQKSQLETKQSNNNECSDCKAGEHCDCTKPSAATSRGTVVNVRLQRTPRTDEAVWAAAALGFLLVLLTLSILHTRLYRHWRTTPSLYWRDPYQDYDSVADVIRRRLRIAKKRPKRGRRKECVLLPSSSSSDENP
ncbi:tumor protein p53-inducible protein 13 [Xiphophorus maculatus]|uniref:Tumor protein p53 inducible protein 13 n=1 Tax=Xiphophorus maculatus TaxID=8083 RepID=M4AC44_XIPMA|nr:tumor protein p53-inducible protein 13 [Xiphophorus maculatus]